MKRDLLAGETTIEDAGWLEMGRRAVKMKTGMSIITGTIIMVLESMAHYGFLVLSKAMTAVISSCHVGIRIHSFLSSKSIASLVPPHSLGRRMGSVPLFNGGRVRP